MMFGDDERRNPEHNAQQNEEPLPELNSVHRCKVVRIEKFGAFLSVEGFRKQGLLHISQFSAEQHQVTNPSDIVEIGDLIWAKVIRQESGKYSMTMRSISQKDGSDSDPNNIKNRQKPKQSSNSNSNNISAYEPLKLEAVLNSTCSKCGGIGHLSSECWSFNNPGSHYELVHTPPPQEEEGEGEDKKQSEKDKLESPKQKRKHKHHHHHHHSTHKKQKHST